MPPPDRIMFYPDFQHDVRPDIAMTHLPYYEWLAFWGWHWQNEALPPDPGEGKRERVLAHVESGRWIWDCSCGSGWVFVEGQPSFCSYCWGPGWVDVILPTNRPEIEAILLQMPGRRGRAPLRDWHHEWPLSRLRDRLRRANEKRAQGDHNPISLSIAPTVAYVVGQTLSATTLRNHVNRPIRDTGGEFGPIELEDTLQLANPTAYAVLYANADGEMTMLAPGTANQPLVSSGPNAAPAFASPGTLEKLPYVDAAWTTNGTVTYQLDSAPVFVRASLVCTNPVRGYAAGDVVVVTVQDRNAVQVFKVTDTGFSFRAADSSITIRAADNLAQTFGATAANFNLRFYLFL